MTITREQLGKAGHTLWQAAVASGGIGEALKSLTDHSVNVPGAEQGLYVAGVAAGGALLSLVKSGVANYSVSHKADKSVRAAAELDVLVKAVEAAYEAKHAPVAAA